MKGKREAKNRRLTDFMKKKEAPKGESAPAPPVPGPGKEEPQEVYEELLKIMGTVPKEVSEARPQEGAREAKEEAKEAPLDEEMAKVLENLEKILNDSNINVIECTSNKECSDGISVGEVFVDKYGIKRQRGFLKTSRMPIYVDFIVEKGEVEPVLRRAYVVRTSRGAMAIVPSSFLCELSTRYGVLLEANECEEEKGLFKK